MWDNGRMDMRHDVRIDDSIEIIDGHSIDALESIDYVLKLIKQLAIWRRNKTKSNPTSQITR